MLDVLMNEASSCQQYVIVILIGQYI